MDTLAPLFSIAPTGDFFPGRDAGGLQLQLGAKFIAKKTAEPYKVSYKEVRLDGCQSKPSP